MISFVRVESLTSLRNEARSQIPEYANLTPLHLRQCIDQPKSHVLDQEDIFNGQSSELSIR